MQDTEERICPLYNFRVNNELYSHYINLDNDSVYLSNVAKKKNIIEYTSDSVAKDIESGETIGRFRLSDNHWYYTDEKTQVETMGNSFSDPDGLLKFEVEISKKYLESKIAKS